MTIGKAPRCFDCKNKIELDQIKPTCKAFPEGIPQSIFFEGEDHSKPLPEQGNNVVFTTLNQL